MDKTEPQQVDFFHECCNPIFDVFVKLIKPAGDYYPQVTLTSFLRVDYADVRVTRLQKVIRFVGLEGLFNYYRGDLDNNEGHFYVQAMKAYPASIAAHEVSESCSILAATRTGKPLNTGEKKVLLLCGRDVADDLELKRLYSQVVELATSLGATCYLKDHPAMHARLNLLHDSACVIDPAIPLELIEDDFMLVIGVASTGLLHFSTRAVSIIKLLSHGEDDVSVRRIAHLASMPGGDIVQFPEDLEVLRGILIKTANT